MTDSQAIFSSCVFLALVSGLPLAPFLSLLYTYFVASFQKKKKLQQAINAGHIVEAYLEKRYAPRGTPESTDRYFATYSFDWKGKKYQRRFKYLNEPPAQLTMYFVKNPKKAEPQNSFIGMETGLLPFFIVGVVVAFVVWEIILSNAIM